MVQAWNSTNDLYVMTVSKFTGDTNNIIIVEAAITDTYRINVLGL